MAEVCSSILLCPNLEKTGARECTENTVRVLHQLGFRIYIDASYADTFSGIQGCNLQFGDAAALIHSSDAVIAIGGDGTILHCSKMAAAAKRPLLGINMGRLGFMASLESDELALLRKLKSGEYTMVRHMMLDATLHRAKEVCTYTALNDVVLFKDSFSKLPDFDVASNGILVSSMRADGLIFSTPTGSTAYSLSAGGPIIEPDMECIEFTQICPHSLFARTMVFSANKQLRITLRKNSEQKVYVSVDGNDGIVFEDKDELFITKSQSSVDLIDLDGNSFYSAINKKLMKPFK